MFSDKIKPPKKQQSNISWQRPWEMCPVARCVWFEFLWDSAKMLFESQPCMWKEHSWRGVMLHLTWKLCLGKEQPEGLWSNRVSLRCMWLFLRFSFFSLVRSGEWESWGFLTDRTSKPLSQSQCCPSDFFSPPSLLPHPLIADQVWAVHVVLGKAALIASILFKELPSSAVSIVVTGNPVFGNKRENL